MTATTMAAALPAADGTCREEEALQAARGLQQAQRAMLQRNASRLLAAAEAVEPAPRRLLGQHTTLAVVGPPAGAVVGPSVVAVTAPVPAAPASCGPPSAETSAGDVPSCSWTDSSSGASAGASRQQSQQQLFASTATSPLPGRTQPGVGTSPLPLPPPPPSQQQQQRFQFGLPPSTVEAAQGTPDPAPGDPQELQGDARRVSPAARVAMKQTATLENWLARRLLGATDDVVSVRASVESDQEEAAVDWRRGGPQDAAEAQQQEQEQQAGAQEEEQELYQRPRGQQHWQGGGAAAAAPRFGDAATDWPSIGPVVAAAAPTSPSREHCHQQPQPTPPSSSKRSPYSRPGGRTRSRVEADGVQLPTPLLLTSELSSARWSQGGDSGSRGEGTRVAEQLQQVQAAAPCSSNVHGAATFAAAAGLAAAPAAPAASTSRGQVQQHASAAPSTYTRQFSSKAGVAGSGWALAGGQQPVGAAAGPPAGMSSQPSRQLAAEGSGGSSSRWSSATAAIPLSRQVSERLAAQRSLHGSSRASSLAASTESLGSAIGRRKLHLPTLAQAEDGSTVDRPPAAAAAAAPPPADVQAGRQAAAVVPRLPLQAMHTAPQAAVPGTTVAGRPRTAPQAAVPSTTVAGRPGGGPCMPPPGRSMASAPHTTAAAAGWGSRPGTAASSGADTAAASTPRAGLTAWGSTASGSVGVGSVPGSQQHTPRRQQALGVTSAVQLPVLALPPPAGTGDVSKGPDTPKAASLQGSAAGTPRKGTASPLALQFTEASISSCLPPTLSYACPTCLPACKWPTRCRAAQHTGLPAFRLMRTNAPPPLPLPSRLARRRPS